MDFSRLWLVGAGVLVGAIAGAYVWAQRAAALANKAAAAAGDDALITAARQMGTSTLGAALQGAMAGAVLGAALVAAYLYFSDPDRGMRVRKVDTGDDRY